MPKIPNYLNEFIIDLQIQLARSLYRSGGSCIKKGKLAISKRVEKYLLKHFPITKKMQFSGILDQLVFDQNTLKDHSNSCPSIFTDFKIKFGNDSKCKYTIIDKSYLGRLEKNLNAKRILHWKYIRIISMN